MSYTYQKPKLTTPTPEHAQKITDRLAYYWTRTEEQAVQLRQSGGAYLPIYEREAEKWSASTSLPNFEPPYGDKEKLAEHFAKVDAICKMTPDCDAQRCLIVMACSAGVQVTFNHELAFLKEKISAKIQNDALAASVKKIATFCPTAAKVLAQEEAQVSAHFPSPSTETLAGQFLVNEVIRGSDPETGIIKEFTIIGYFNSRTRGEHYVVEEELDDGSMKERSYRLSLCMI